MNREGSCGGGEEPSGDPDSDAATDSTQVESPVLVETQVSGPTDGPAYSMYVHKIPVISYISTERP